jgi:hypothetical protein
MQKLVCTKESALDTNYKEPFTDILQDPLQPLGENLSTSDYLSLETCPVKYDAYEKVLLSFL